MAFGRQTGLRVSEYALGTANFGTAWGGGADHAEARKMFDRFAEAGGRLIDTADCYGFGTAEEYLSDCLAADREHFVVSSKFTCSASAKPGVLNTGNSRRTMRRAVEDSLRRLGTDHLDLYWAHFADPLTPVEEVVAAFDDLVRSGKVLYAGLSNFPAWRAARAATIAELRGLAPVIAIQAEYSLVERTAERDLLPMADALGLGVALWSPLGGGLLTGKYRVDSRGRLTDWKRAVHVENTEQKTAVVDAVLAVAAEVGAPPARVAMAWLRHRAARSATTYVPIIGPRDTAQLEDYLAALDLVLSEEQVTRLDEVSAVPLGVPHEIGRNILWSVVPGTGDQVTWPAVPVA
jgi:aryl-alcohol dehydrogenase-like predicted oxidoreductase